MNEITRIQKLIAAARSWHGSKAPHDQHQATAALSRARALCAKHGIPEARFHWPDRASPSMAGLRGTRADFIIIDDPWAGFPIQDIPIKTADEILREYMAEKRRQEAVEKFSHVLRRQGFAANHASDAFRYFAEAMAAAQKAAADKDNKS